MTAAEMDDLPPDLRVRVSSLGYELERWSAARRVLAARLVKHRLVPQLESFLTAWVDDHLPMPLDATLSETPTGWRLIRGGLGQFAIERALLHLPTLRSFWVQELRLAHFEALRKWVPEAWVLDDSPLPAGAVIAGLGISAWREFPLRHDVDQFVVEDRAGMPVDSAWADWNATIHSRANLLTRRIRPSRSIRATFLRDERGRIVLQDLEALS